MHMDHVIIDTTRSNDYCNNKRSLMALNILFIYF